MSRKRISRTVRTPERQVTSEPDTKQDERALQKAAEKPPGPKGLRFVKEAMSAAPKQWKDGAVQVFMSEVKTREQLAGELLCEIDKATGLPFELADRLIHQVASGQVWPRPKGQDEVYIAAITAIAEFAPCNIIEANLAAQMIATNEAAQMFLYRATLPEQPTEHIDLNMVRATRLMRLHLEQIEAMQKLKGKAGQQKVTVEHVHVHEGGQAIVGAVSAMKGEGDGGK